MRLSKAQGEAKAIRLAERHLAAQDSKGWNFKCVSARPDYMLSPATDRKVPTKWSVVVECYKEGAPIDGPLVLIVDIAKNEVTTLEQAIHARK